MIITLKGADFSASNIGTLSSWRITRSLGAGATYEGVTSVEKGAAFSATVTLAEGYEVGTAGVTITMGGAVLEGAYSISDNVITITIAEVTGNVLIKVPTINTATGGEEEPEVPDTPDEPEDITNATNLTQTVLTIDGTGIGAATGEFNTKPYIKGEPYSATTMHCSDFIPVKNGDVITYRLRGAGPWAAVLAFYASNDVSTVVDTVPSVEATADVAGTYTCPSDGYVRFANRMDYTFGYAYINCAMPANNIATTSLTIDATGIGTGESTPGGTTTVKGGNYSASTMRCSDFIPVAKGDVVAYRLRSAGAWGAVLAFYTSNDVSNVVDTVAAENANSDVVGTYICPDNGYIKIANRMDYSVGCVCINA